MTNDKRVLVTGGLGFLGSHLIEHLLQDGDEITIVDNMSSNVVEPAYFEDRCKVIVENIASYQPEHSFNRIYHLASVVGPAGVLPHAGQIGISVMADMMAVIELSLAMDAKLLSVSTSEVYGRDGTFSEDVHMVIPANYTVRLEYGAGKLLAEIACLNKARVTDLWVNIVRPFNIVGPRQSSKGGFVLPRFIELALEGKPLTVFGDGKQIRSFTHAADIVDGMVTIMNSDVKGEVFNVGNPANTVTINELAQRVIDATQSSSSIVHVDPKTIYGPLYDEAFDKIPSVEKMERVFGWKAKLGLEDTIGQTLTYFHEDAKKGS